MWLSAFPRSLISHCHRMFHKISLWFHGFKVPKFQFEVLVYFEDRDPGLGYHWFSYGDRYKSPKRNVPLPFLAYLNGVILTLFMVNNLVFRWQKPLYLPSGMILPPFTPLTKGCRAHPGWFWPFTVGSVAARYVLQVAAVTAAGRGPWSEQPLSCKSKWNKWSKREREHEWIALWRWIT